MPAMGGALLIRNSRGTGWGGKGHGRLSYEYVLKGLAEDW
jgi:C1A family cysteine protease